MTNPSAAPSTPTTPVTSAPAVPSDKAVKPAKKADAKAPPVAAKKTAATASKTPKTTASAAAKTIKSPKIKKPKLVRDSFTIPKDEYAVIETLKQRATTLAQPIKKSELLRAGLKALAGLSDSALRSALQAVPAIKTGRPKAEAAATAAKPSAKSPRSK